MKMFGLAAIAAVAAMALVGATSASATSTSLCKVHQEPCQSANQIKTLHMVNTAGTVGFLLNSTADVLCLHVLGVATVGALASPQSLTTTNLLFGTCGTNAAHNNCTVTVETSPNFTLLKTALNLGTLTALNGQNRVKCTILGFIKIDCVYDGTGLTFAVEGALHQGATTGHGMLTATNSPVSLKEGTGLCPATASLDGLLEPLEHTYIVS